ncbi:hypothetical protein VTI74DRAFT_4835 [Chaetomium olivicolor]
MIRPRSRCGHRRNKFISFDDHKTTPSVRLVVCLAWSSNCSAKRWGEPSVASGAQLTLIAPPPPCKITTRAAAGGWRTGGDGRNAYLHTVGMGCGHTGTSGTQRGGLTRSTNGNGPRHSTASSFGHDSWMTRESGRRRPKQKHTRSPAAVQAPHNAARGCSHGEPIKLSVRSRSAHSPNDWLVSAAQVPSRQAIARG